MIFKNIISRYLRYESYNRITEVYKKVVYKNGNRVAKKLIGFFIVNPHPSYNVIIKSYKNGLEHGKYITFFRYPFKVAERGEKRYGKMHGIQRKYSPYSKKEEFWIGGIWDNGICRTLLTNSPEPFSLKNGLMKSMSDGEG